MWAAGIGRRYFFLPFLSAFGFFRPASRLGRRLQRSQPDFLVPLVERAQVVETLIPGARTLGRDIGIQMVVAPSAGSPRLALGLFNGSGANHLAAIGLRPAAVIGDLDSIRSGIRAWVGENRLVHRPDQNRTDLDKALDFAFAELGLARLTVLAATGGRCDHEQANLGLLARLGLGPALRFAVRWLTPYRPEIHLAHAVEMEVPAP